MSLESIRLSVPPWRGRIDWARWLPGRRSGAGEADPLTAMRNLLAGRRGRHCFASLVQVTVLPVSALDRVGPLLRAAGGFGPAGRLGLNEVALLFVDADGSGGELPSVDGRREEWLDAVANLLKEIGMQGGLSSLRVATAHRWTDRLGGLNELFAALR